MASNNIKLSATRVNSFLQCKLKYKFNYIEKLPKVSNPAFKMGLACHEALEYAGSIWLKKEDLTKADKAKVLKKYDEVSVKEGIADHSAHLLGCNLVKVRINDFMAGAEGKLVSLEHRFGFRKMNEVTTKDGVPLIGAIDKVVENNEDTLLIVDYKTSKTAPTPEQLRTDIQLSIYDYVAHKLYPGYKRIILSLDMLKSDMLYTYRTEEERVEFEAYLKVVYDSMTKFDSGKAEASLNMFCPWCDFKDYCDEYESACKKSDYNFLATISLSDEELIGEWKRVRDTKKILDGRERELAMVAMEKIRETGEELMGVNEQLYIRQNARTTYDTKTVFSLVPKEDFVNLVNINKGAVDKYLNDNSTIKSAVVSSAQVNFTTPFLATKKIKKVKEKV